MGSVHTLGASFRFHSENLALSPEEHQDNLRQLQETSPDLAERLCLDELDVRHLDGRAGFRCTSPDYLPLVGPLAASDSFKQTYQALARDARLQPDAPCPWLEGLYLSTAHGSRGLLSAPMAGELLAGWINQEPLPVPRAVAEACHPNRFMLRKLIRGQS
jgi:tRNA 5-methylaminomethyl-2-thiouridine biosynthesis bifunctional protein